VTETTETQGHDIDFHERARHEVHVWEDPMEAAEREAKRVAKVLIEKFKKDLEEGLKKQMEEAESGHREDAKVSEATETQDHDIDSLERARHEMLIWEDPMEMAGHEGREVARSLIEKYKEDLEEGLKKLMEEAEPG